MLKRVTNPMTPACAVMVKDLRETLIDYPVGVNIHTRLMAFDVSQQAN
jgi:hypothetical protein